MSKEKDGLIFRILFWPMIYMGKDIEKVHAKMDEERHGDAFLQEDKRAIGVAGAVSGCFMTMVWLVFLLIVAIVLLVVWIF